jgi:hypothetical protein
MIDSILLRDLDHAAVMVHVLRERLVDHLSMFEEVAVAVLDLCAKVNQYLATI